MEAETINIVQDPKKGNTTGSTEEVITIKGLNISFGDNQVLKDFDMKLYKGENLVVLGKSGSGKSVLIKCIVLLIEPDSGSISVLGEEIEDLKDDKLNALRKKVGFLFQSAALFDSMTVRENLLFPLRDEKELGDEEKESLVKEVLENVGLTEAIDKMPSELSGGMRKRVGLARTLILKPEIILYDEPTTGLDPITSREISKLMLEVQKKYNTASVIITHDLACARIVADRVIILKDGAAGAEGTFEELETSGEEWVNAYFK